MILLGACILFDVTIFTNKRLYLSFLLLSVHNKLVYDDKQ